MSESVETLALLNAQQDEAGSNYLKLFFNFVKSHQVPAQLISALLVEEPKLQLAAYQLSKLAHFRQGLCYTFGSFH